MTTYTGPAQEGIRRLGLLLIGGLLLGYLVGDKGFAHISIPPVYIGEVILMAALALFALAPDFRAFLSLSQLWLLVALTTWCLLRTVPYIDEYGMDALRDAVIYGYALFGLLIAAWACDRQILEKTCLLYHRSVTISIIALPFLLWAVDHTVSSPEELSLFLVKSGDVAVHLAGAFAFRMTGLRDIVRSRTGLGSRLIDGLFWLCWAGLAVWMIATSRGAMLAIIAGGLVIALFGYGRRQMAAFLLATVLLASIASLLSLRVEEGRRDVSLDQISRNVSSILVNDGTSGGDLDSNTEWRLRWWGTIIDYTLYGDYFWTGKGFGINLSLDDIGTVGSDDQLRSPHNGHLTILARTGVPGFLLWCATMGTFAFTLARRAVLLKRAGLQGWSRLNVCILSYWTAAAVNAAFDVYLEGPQGGIWFWSLYGFGLASMAAEKFLRPTLSGSGIPANGAPANGGSPVSPALISPAPAASAPHG